MASIHDLIVAIRDAGKHEPDTMVSLTLHSDNNRWAQLLPEKINLCYPFVQSPNNVLADLQIPHADKAIVGFWQANLFADFETSSMTVDQLTSFISAYLTAAFGTDDLERYDVSFDIAERGTIEADSTQEFLRKIVALKRHLEGKSPRK